MSINAAIELHKKYFGTDPKVVAFAPGRINLIGEHTDYNGGFVMPAAIDKGIWIAGRVIDGETRLISDSAGPGKPFCAGSVELGEVSGWAKFAAGMAWVLRDDFGPMPNIEATVVSNLPMGSGVSSSAAIEMAFGRLFEALAGFEVDAKKLALLGQKCENHYVGVNCGVMDQMASACGQKDRAVLIDTRSLDIDLCSVPADYSLLLLDTKKPRALTDSAYNERRSQCEKASDVMGVPQLRDANLEMLRSAKAKLDPVVYRRAKHVITEDARSAEFRNVLASQDENGVFALMKGSHWSLRDNYEVSCAELDAMAESAWVSPGVVGARMTGAGFGGACVALVRTEEVEEFIPICLSGYKAKTGREGAILVCSIEDGARILQDF